MSLDGIEEGEYRVVGNMSVDVPHIYHDEKGDTIFLSFNLRSLVVKTRVEDYNQANYHLLAVAERIRNYAAYASKMRLPLSFQMVGKRPYIDTFPFPFPAVYDGGTGLPMSNGGINDVAIFITRFGPVDGLKPPIDARETIETLKKWIGEFNSKLELTQSLLDKIKNGTPLDAAVSSLGKSIWLKGIEERLTCRWRAIEAITKIDYPDNEKMRSDKMFKTIRKRLEKPPNREQFNRLRDLRNLSTHGMPSQEQFIDVHLAADKLYLIASEVIESAMREAGICMPDK